MKKLPTGIPVNSNHFVEDHSAARFKDWSYHYAFEYTARFNETGKKKNGYPRRWHLVVVPIRPFVA